MTVTETTCENCGNVTTDDPPPPYCSGCGEQNPWKERSAYQFDEDDLPIVFSYEVYDDGWQLWNRFAQDYWGVYELNGSDVSGLPEQFPDLKYCVFTVWFKITDGYDLEGPFLSKEDARA